MRADVSEAGARGVFQNHGLPLLELFQLLSLNRWVGLSESTNIQQIVALEQDSRVAWVENQTGYVTVGERDHDSGTFQYALKKIRADVAHELATGKGVKIALIDTGVDDQHVALKGKVVDKSDLVGGFANPGLHGTALAGIIAAEGKIEGVAPHSHLLAIKAFQPNPNKPLEGISTTDKLARALDYAVVRQAHIINLSFGGAKSRLLTTLIEHAIRFRITVVAAAGNGGPSGKPVYPAVLEPVIAATAVDHADRLYPAATRGSYIAVAAPGVDILSTAPGNRYRLVSGTSVAAAHVTGIIALLLEKNSNLTPEEIKTLLESAAMDLGQPGKDPEYGAGRADALNALERLLGLAASDRSTFLAPPNLQPLR